MESFRTPKASKEHAYRVTSPPTAGITAKQSQTRLWIYHRPEIRCLGRHHEAEMMKLVLNLDTASRCNRFGAMMKDRRLIEYCRHACDTATYIAGTYIDGNLRGFMEVYETSDPGLTELALLVDRDWRGHGLGIALLNAAKQWAVRFDRRTLRMIISGNNWPMRRLADKAGARFDIVDDDIVADIVLRNLHGTAPGATIPHRPKRECPPPPASATAASAAVGKPWRLPLEARL